MKMVRRINNEHTTTNHITNGVIGTFKPTIDLLYYSGEECGSNDIKDGAVTFTGEHLTVHMTLKSGYKFFEDVTYLGIDNAYGKSDILISYNNDLKIKRLTSDEVEFIVIKEDRYHD